MRDFGAKEEISADLPSSLHYVILDSADMLPMPNLRSFYEPGLDASDYVPYSTLLASSLASDFESDRRVSSLLYLIMSLYLFVSICIGKVARPPIDR